MHKMTYLLRYTLFVLLLFSITLVFGQNYTLSKVPLPKENGLSGNRVIDILQDNDEFVWLFTQNGIVRFDGYEYQWFNKTNSELREIPNPRHVAEDADGYLWLNQNDKIDLLHHRTFEVIRFEDKFQEIAKEPFICKAIFQADNGHIFLEINKNDKQVYYLYHPKSGIKQLSLLRHQKRNFNFYRNNKAIWLYSGKGKWNKFHLESETVTKNIQLDENTYDAIKPIPNSNTKDLFSARQGDEFVILEISKNSKIKEVFRFTAKKDKIPFYSTFHYHNQKELLLSFHDEQISIIDLKNKKKITPQSRQDIDRKINRILLIDNNGVIWAKSKEKGIQLFKIHASKFTTYQPDAAIRSMMVKDGFLFTNRHKIPLSSPEKATELGLRRSNAYDVNNSNNIWVSYENGLKNIYTSSGETQADIIFSKSVPIKHSMWSVLQDKKGKWWCGLSKGIVVSYPTNPDSLYVFEKYNAFPQLKNSTVYQFIEEGDYLWAVANTGLYYIHKQKGVVQQYALGAKTGFQLPISNIHFLYKDANDTYWIASNADGLVRFELNKDRTVKSYETYNTTDGLSSNVLYAIIPDDKERLWISTLNGLTLFDKKMEQFQAFYEQDGLYQTEFNRISYAKSNSEQIYFGTPTGVISFNPNDFDQNQTYKTPINIVRFEKYRNEDNQITDYTTELIDKQQIVLEPNDRFFRLRVSMIDFFNSNEIRYYYKIKGLFKDFQPMTGNVIELGSLPYGKYELIVKGQGANKQFSEEELVIPLIVKCPFYFQWWFILLAIGLVGFAVFQAYQWRIRQLQEREQRLKLLVAQRTAQIQKDKTTIEAQATQLKELDELKSKFFANISHELRTPLTLILAPLSNFLKTNTFTNKQYTQLLLMQRNGQKLLKRINELLDLSRLDANKLEVNNRPTFLYPFFKTLLSTFESAANLNNIQLNFDYQLNEDVQVAIDEDKLEKIVANYLSNALKFTPKNGTITLLVKKENRKLQISVSDTGTGILEEDLTKIFDRFYQAKQKNQAQGTGIGLSLCQELAKVMKGRVWATSEIGKGSTFNVELPFVETFALKEIEEKETIALIITKTPKSSKPKHQKTILVVEDNPDLRSFLTIILEEKYNVIAAQNGQEALERLTNHQSPITNHLIISDIMMPIMDGIELLTKVKANDELRHLPFILLTARQSLDVKIDALRIGVDDYLTKPFKAEELMARIDNLINNAEQRIEQQPTTKANQQQKLVTIADTNWLKEVETIILNNIENGSFTLNQLADELFITPRTLQQKIKHITGKTPKQYQRDIQMHVARQKNQIWRSANDFGIRFSVGF